MSSSGETGHRAHHARRDARRIAVLDYQLQDCLRRLETTRRDIELIRAGLSRVLHNHVPAVERLAGRLERREGTLAHAGSRTDLARTSEELRRVSRLLEQLLALADIDRRRVTMRLVDLTALAAVVVGRLREREPQRSVDIHIAADLWIEADKDLLEMLSTVLIEDAWERTRRGDRAGIQIGCATIGSDTVCFVRDNGGGFDPAQAGPPGPGSRAGAGSRRWNGLGLILARRIAERHGGRLWVDACPEIGATIYFTLAPAAVAAVCDPAHAALG